MNDNEIEIRKVVALESIATSLQEMVKRPLPLKTVEKRLEMAMDANAEAVEVAVADVVLADDDALGDPMEAMEKMVKADETKASKKMSASLSPGMRVKIESDTLNDGCIGSITELRGTTWVTVKVEKGNNEKEKGDTITVSRGQCVILKGEGNAETATEVIEEPELAPDPNVLIFDWSDMDHPETTELKLEHTLGVLFTMSIVSVLAHRRLFTSWPSRLQHPNQTELKSYKRISLY